VLSFFALEQESRCLCYSNADLTRADQNGEVMRFVEFWHAITATDPQWLYFDSKLIDYPESKCSKPNAGLHRLLVQALHHTSGRLSGRGRGQQ
jgi:hypothetical protein